VRRVVLPLFLISLIAVDGQAQAREHRDRKLEAKLAGLAAEVDGDVGIYVHNLRTGVTAEVNADTVFPTASMITVPILVTLFDQIGKGTVDIHQRLTYTDALYYPVSVFLGSF
jgi:beta-lactamase class A